MKDQEFLVDTVLSHAKPWGGREKNLQGNVGIQRQDLQGVLTGADGIGTPFSNRDAVQGIDDRQQLRKRQVGGTFCDSAPSIE